MPVTNDIAMAGGCEAYGFPKKIADVQIKHEGESSQGWPLLRSLLALL